MRDNAQNAGRSLAQIAARLAISAECLRQAEARLCADSLIYLHKAVR